MAFLRRQRDRASGPGELALYYASDVHGSDVCWRKFLRAGAFYKADALVMGGDLTGKAVVPIAREPDGSYTARFLGEARAARDEAELAELTDAVRLNGMYPWVADSAAIDEVSADGRRQSDLFDRVIADEIRRWMQMADERLDESSTAAYVIAGNDDPWYVDDALRSSKRMQFCDDQVVQLGDHELLSLSYANPTPWDSPRELPEDELYTRLRSLSDQLERPETAIFNLHVPPYDSGLDRAVAIDSELRVKVEAGGTSEVPVGSTAVRQILEEVQPMLSLHGHIHESRGAAHLGRTLAINSGSEYNTGRIHGVVVKIAADRVANHQFVIG
jgi:Icc-related predicted phosphoesterase